MDSESVREAIAKKNWSPNTRALAIAAYNKFLEVTGGTSKPPKCRRTRKLPFIPLESEVDALISGVRTKLAIFLRLLEETGLRSGEAWCLKWRDVDFKNRTIILNEPEKYGTPRILRISPTLVAMLRTMQNGGGRIFTGRLGYFRDSFHNYRKRTSFKLKNPKLSRITFHTICH